MKVTLTVERKMETDGETSVYSYTKEGLENVEDFLSFYETGLIGSGFTYIGYVGAVSKDEQKEYWSGW
jgi:hypothetical protein